MVDKPLKSTNLVKTDVFRYSDAAAAEANAAEANAAEAAAEFVSQLNLTLKIFYLTLMFGSKVLNPPLRVMSSEQLHSRTTRFESC